MSEWDKAAVRANLVVLRDLVGKFEQTAREVSPFGTAATWEIGGADVAWWVDWMTRCLEMIHHGYHLASLTRDDRLMEQIAWVHCSWRQCEELYRELRRMEMGRIVKMTRSEVAKALELADEALAAADALLAKLGPAEEPRGGGSDEKSA